MYQYHISVAQWLNDLMVICDRGESESSDWIPPPPPLPGFKADGSRLELGGWDRRNSWLMMSNPQTTNLASSAVENRSKPNMKLLQSVLLQSNSNDCTCSKPQLSHGDVAHGCMAFLKDPKGGSSSNNFWTRCFQLNVFFNAGTPLKRFPTPLSSSFSATSLLVLLRVWVKPMARTTWNWPYLTAVLTPSEKS